MIGRRLRVCLMALNATSGSGIARYTTSLTRAFGDVADEFERLELELATTTQGAAIICASGLDTLVVGRDRGRSRVIIEQVAALRRRAHLLHYFDIGAPLLVPGTPFVTTFHDAAIRQSSSRFGGLRRTYKHRLYPLALRRSERVVTVSAFARDEAIRHFDVNPNKISVIHSGPGLTSVEDDHRRPDPARPYLLFVGNLTRSKNVPFLVRSFELADVGVDLVLAGRAADHIGEIDEAVARIRGHGRIRVVRDPTDDELERLYVGAEAFLFPSRYEGFGFPPLEAMARGCPVVASDIPAAREIVGDGGLLVPLDEAAWAAEIRRVASDSQLREELRARGRIVVARYSWQEAARAVCRLFESIAEERS